MLIETGARTPAWSAALRHRAAFRAALSDDDLRWRANAWARSEKPAHRARIGPADILYDNMRTVAAERDHYGPGGQSSGESMLCVAGMYRAHKSLDRTWPVAYRSSLAMTQPAIVRRPIVTPSRVAPAVQVMRCGIGPSNSDRSIERLDVGRGQDCTGNAIRLARRRPKNGLRLVRGH